MLQQSPHPSLDHPNLSVAELSSPAELLDYFVHFLRQQYLVILFSSLLMIGVGGAYLLVARPVYTAVATMLIDTHKAQFLQQQASYNDAQTDSAAVESQVRVLKSDNIALEVIKKLQLTSDPEFVGSNPPSGADSEYIRMRDALAAFKLRLDVARDMLSYVIEVRFHSYDADKSAAIANALIDAYITDQLDSKYQSTLRASNWLEGRIRDLRDQTSAAEQAVVDYEQASSIVGASGKTTNDQQVTELNTQLLVAKAQVAEARAKLDRIQTVLTSDSGGTVDATVTDALKNDIVSKLRTQYLDLTNKEHDWAARYGKDHLAVVNLRNQMAEINAAIVDEVRQIAGTYKSDFEIAKQHADELQKAYDGAVAQAQKDNQAKVILNDLQSKAKTYRELYETFLQRYTDSVQQQTFPITEAHIISPALRPLTKSSPKTLLTLAISACAGIILGFGIGVFRDLWNRVFRTTEQAEKLLHVPCITLVPALRERERAVASADARKVEIDSQSTGRTKTSLSETTQFEWPVVIAATSAANDSPADLPLSAQNELVSSEADKRAVSDAENTSAAITDAQAAASMVSVTEAAKALLAGAKLSEGGAGASSGSEVSSAQENPESESQGGVPLDAHSEAGEQKLAAAVTLDEVVGSQPASGRVTSEAALVPTIGRILKRDSSALWTVVDAPFSRFAESLRMLKVAIDLNDLARTNKVIGFTSSLPNEGKSTLAAALALLIAQSGGRVILVDCDLRNPSLTRTLAPSAESGYIELVSKRAKIDDALWFADANNGLPFIPCVIKSRVAHTSEILASSATKDLFAQLRRTYEYIIVDLSPLAPVVDVRTTAHFIDSYICVIEWGRTKIDVVKKTLSDAPGVYQNLVGTVLNKADISKLHRYDSHRGNYYYNKHYMRYGYID